MLLMIGRELKQPLDCLRAELVPVHESPGLQKAKAQVADSQARMKGRFDATHFQQGKVSGTFPWWRWWSWDPLVEVVEVRIKHLLR